jgi:hypothetical protein
VFLCAFVTPDQVLSDAAGLPSDPDPGNLENGAVTGAVIGAAFFGGFLALPERAL